MNIGIIGATGKAGQLILQEAIKRDMTSRQSSVTRQK